VDVVTDVVEAVVVVVERVLVGLGDGMIVVLVVVLLVGSSSQEYVVVDSVELRELNVEVLIESLP
jgi:hypothetical protein